MENVVKSAAALLDLLHPGWAEWIDLDSHSQYDAEKCTAGQIATRLGFENNISRAGTSLGLESSWYFERLDAAWSEITAYDGDSGSTPFSAGYNDEWKDEIRARLPKPQRAVIVGGAEITTWLNEETSFEAGPDSGQVTVTDSSGDSVVLDIEALAEIVGLRVVSADTPT